MVLQLLIILVVMLAFHLPILEISEIITDFIGTAAEFLSKK